MRKLMWLSIGFALACGMCVWILSDGWIIPLAILTGLSAVLLRWKSFRRTAVVCLGCAAGLAWFLLFQRYYLMPARMMDGVKLKTTVTTTGYSYETDYGVGVDGKFELEGISYQVRLYINDTHQRKPGDTITGTFYLRYTAPDGMQDPTYHAGDRILFLGYQRGDIQVLRAMEEDTAYFAAELAYGISQRLEALFPKDTAGFVKAVLLGDDSGLSYAEDTALRVSGIRHIIAVSGLHVAILYTVLCAVTWNRRYFTALLGIPVLVLFAAVAGFTPSVCRACIMVGLMMLSQIFNREYDPATALSFASLVMLLWNPLMITSVSFQMSVACVAGILLFNESISGWLKEKLGNPKGKSLRAKVKRWFISSVSVTLSAITLTTPMSAYYFGTVSIIGVVTNLLTLWAVQWIFIGVIISLLLSLLWFKGAGAAAWCVGWLVRYVLKISHWMAAFPLASVYTESVYVVIWLVFVYLLLAMFVLYRGKHPLVFSCCTVLSLCAALLVSWVEPLTADTHLTLLDVGQGQSIIVQHQGKAFLIDCGGSNDEIAANKAVETLLSRGISHLDGIILTHGDRDHAGGIPYLLKRMDSDFLMLPATTDPNTRNSIIGDYTGQVIAVEDNLLLTLGETKLTVFGPIFAAQANENSLCVLFEGENCDILVTGDRGRIGEMLLLRQMELPEVDLLIAGHHGSKFSSSEELLEVVRPDVVFISVGEDNAYGHPARDTLERFTAYGSVVYRTDQNGTLIFRR